MTTNRTQVIYTRRRWGRGFQYYNAVQEKLICPKILKHIKSLAIPPMWTKVEISPSPNTKIQATGRDSKNRKQYIYSENWQIKQQIAKFKQLTAFATKLPEIRKHCYALLDEPGAPKEKILALMVLILDETGIRIGNKRYTQTNQTHGLSTLGRKHLVDDAQLIKFEFIGKSSKAREVKIEDPNLGKHIKDCAEFPGHNLFRYNDSDGKWQDVASEDVNEFIQNICEQNFTAKDFRTWNGTCFAVEAYHQIGPNITQSTIKPLNQVVSQVSEKLGNTPTVCKEYYIHPKVQKAIVKTTIPFNSDLANNSTSNSQEHSAIERETLRILGV